VLLQQPLEGQEPVGQALRVVQPINPENDLKRRKRPRTLRSPDFQTFTLYLTCNNSRFIRPVRQNFVTQ
jgi:hypothetical protein